MRPLPNLRSLGRGEGVPREAYLEPPPYSLSPVPSAYVLTLDQPVKVFVVIHSILPRDFAIVSERSQVSLHQNETDIHPRKEIRLPN